MYRIEWLADERIVMTPAGDFRSIEGATEAALRHVSQLNRMMGVTHARIVDRGGRQRGGVDLAGRSPAGDAPGRDRRRTAPRR